MKLEGLLDCNGKWVFTIMAELLISVNYPQSASWSARIYNPTQTELVTEQICVAALELHSSSSFLA